MNTHEVHALMDRAEACGDVQADLDALLQELGDTVVLQRNREGGYRVMTVAPLTAWRADPIDTDTLAEGLAIAAQRRITASATR